MKSLFAPAIELQMDPDQRDRAAKICLAINRHLVSSGLSPEAFPSLGSFVRSDEWDDYLHLNGQDSEHYPFFEVDDRGFYAKDIDFIHAYCMDGNHLSSFVNSVDRDTVTAEDIIGQVFYYGLPSIATWFNRHSPRLAHVKAFELILANLLEADKTIEGYFKEEIPLSSPFITPRRAVAELHLQSLYSGIYGKYREREQQIISPASLDILLNPASQEQSASYRHELNKLSALIAKDGGACEDARVEIAQNLLVGTIINPGFFLMISGEPLEVIRESIQVKTHAWAQLNGFDPALAVESIEFLLLSIDPQLLERAQLGNRHWYRPKISGVPQLEGTLTGMGGYESVPFSQSYKFYTTHYGDELTVAIVKMLEADHHHFKNVLSDDCGYHPVVDQMLQRTELTLGAIRTVGTQMMQFRDCLRRYSPEGLSYAALRIYQTPESDRYSIDAGLLQFIVSGCAHARKAIIAQLDEKAVITLEDLENNGLCPADSPALMKKFRIEDADDLFARELGL
ncbi:hypothetical protein [Pseudomonas viridiflava]|uniref:hypothetical protein n=1 Tax=Pseudomonas viridiflava TaxID=33069 RepID=UPI001F14591E|nr:hypothetical protein [Pseudomonas viridiflava]